jgi:hypothetical protein
MKPPPWLAQKIAETGAQQVGGEIPGTEAESAIAAATREHPEYGEALAVAGAVSHYRKWVRGHRSSGDLFQAQMLEGLPASMLVAPQREMPVADMTGTDLDHAKNMLYARTTNAVRGARKTAMAERQVFDRLYERVRKLLEGDLTVSQVLPQAILAAAPELEDDGRPDWLVLAAARLEPEGVATEIEKHPEYVHELLVVVANGLHDGLTLAEAIKAATGTAA